MKGLYSIHSAKALQCRQTSLLVICFGLFLALFSSGQASAQESPSVALVKPAGADINAITIGGTVIPYRSVTVAAQRPGRITALYARTGMMLQFNQPVAALDDDVLRQQINGVKAQLKAAQSNLDYAIFATPGMDSAGGMMGAMMGAMMGSSGSSGVDAWLARVNRINQARSEIDRLKAQERALQAQVGYGAITSPMNGIVTRRMVEAGEIVKAGQPLIKIAYVSRLRAQFDIPVALARGVTPGQQFTLRTGDGRLIPVSIGEVAPGVDPRTHTQQVKVDIPPQSGLRLGDYVELLLARTHTKSNSVVIPAAALLRGSALPMVQVVTGDGTIVTKIVRVDEKLPNHRLLISAGLSAGEIVRVQP